MVRDAYANYVVQTTLDVIAEGEEKRLLMEELNSHSVELVRSLGPWPTIELIFVYDPGTFLLHATCLFTEKLHICQAYCRKTRGLVLYLYKLILTVLPHLALFYTVQTLNIPETFSYNNSTTAVTFWTVVIRLEA